MLGLGTIINVLGVIAGGLIGLFFTKGLKPRYKEMMLISNGVCVLFLGIGGVLKEMLVITDGKVQTTGALMMILCLLVGSVIGEFLDLDGKVNHFGNWLKIKSKNEDNATFMEGILTSSVTISIGAMAIVGAIEDGLHGDYTILVAKTILDSVFVMIWTSALGSGCIFSAIPVGILQGSVTLLAGLVEPVLTAQALSNLSLVGSVMIFMVGLNLVWDMKIRIVNTLPALVLAVIWAWVVI